ncbi:hypothetical protein EW093_12185 [Thiospirochaeta perfilievii]|uniref:Addiction module protein n=1 Tax=Thiospirochaeta perfilievii TaxID=252967 RepID=A0A5C1QEK8_9SPIO|nr:hypothetical protein [Thiospirochaeta perfilievii]QEN05439.1 hypothetical protein EW093_12185 [Thiospirochaeta perfilievii]
MEALRYIERIDSDVITIKNLKRFKGRNVEIIILPYESQISDYDEEWGNESEERIEAFNNGKFNAFDGESAIAELKNKYSIK